MITNLFKKEKNIFGMIHFPPLIGFEGYPGQDTILQKAIKDLNSLTDGGVDAIIIENNYDIPHTKYIDPEITSQMTFLALELRKIVDVPMGICCLWNDWKSSLAIAKIANLDFVRIPVFVDKIKTNYSYIIEENPSEILEYRKKIGAENIKIITDIHVKHSEILNNDSLIESSLKAIKYGSDGLIITGNWTGDLPKFDDLENVRKAVGNFPIIIGSGVDEKNIKSVLNIVDAMIIGTYFKTKKYLDHTINIKSWEEEIDKEKVKKLIELI